MNFAKLPLDHLIFLGCTFELFVGAEFDVFFDCFEIQSAPILENPSKCFRVSNNSARRLRNNEKKRSIISMKAKIELRGEISFQREDNVCSIGETKGFTVCIFVLPSVQAPKTTR